MNPERFGQQFAIAGRWIWAESGQGRQRCGCSAGRGWIFGLLLGLVCNAGLAAQPAQPKTAADIERALSVPGSPPGWQLRGAPSPSGGVGRLRGPAGIVDDPASTPPALRPPASAPTVQSIQSTIENLDYPTLIRERPKVAALIRFDLNSAHIRSDAYSLLNEYVSAFQSPALANAVLLIAGHTDAAGSAQHNLRLSDQRAQAVRNYLIEQGIAPDRLIARGYGSAHPIASNATAAGRELNRRSEFIRLDVTATANP